MLLVLADISFTSLWCVIVSCEPATTMGRVWLFVHVFVVAVNIPIETKSENKNLIIRLNVSMDTSEVVLLWLPRPTGVPTRGHIFSFTFAPFSPDAFKHRNDGINTQRKRKVFITSLRQ